MTEFFAINRYRWIRKGTLFCADFFVLASYYHKKVAGTVSSKRLRRRKPFWRSRAKGAFSHKGSLNKERRMAGGKSKTGKSSGGSIGKARKRTNTLASKTPSTNPSKKVENVWKLVASRLPA